jgi:hypothetical protein
VIALSVLVYEDANADATQNYNSHDRLRIKLPKFRRFLRSMLVVASGAVPRLSNSREMLDLYANMQRSSNW